MTMPNDSRQADVLSQQVTDEMKRAGAEALDAYEFLDAYALVKEVYKAMVLVAPRSMATSEDLPPSRVF